jgi:hypothetical protein
MTVKKYTEEQSITVLREGEVHNSYFTPAVSGQRYSP